MLHILFFILKIIGMILLLILGIALIIVGMILFIPIRYRLQTETTNGMEELKTVVRASWLFHFVSAHVIYQNKESDWQFRVAWIKFNTNKQNEVAEEIFDDTSDSSNEGNRTNETGSNSKTRTSNTIKKSKKNKTSNWVKKIKCTIKEIYDKIKHIKDYIQNEAHIKAFMRLKNEIVYLIKKLKPDTIKGYLRFGLEDPYHTGLSLAALSVFYPFYGDCFEIYPDFEKKILETDIFFKGRIYIIHLIIILLRLYLDKNVKTAYNNLGGNKNG